MIEEKIMEYNIIPIKLYFEILIFHRKDYYIKYEFWYFGGKVVQPFDTTAMALSSTNVLGHIHSYSRMQAAYGLQVRHTKQCTKTVCADAIILGFEF